MPTTGRNDEDRARRDLEQAEGEAAELAADTGADVVVAGNRGYGPVAALFLGSRRKVKLPRNSAATGP